MSNYAFNIFKAKTAIIIQEESSDYSMALAKYFVDNFKKLTGNDNAILATVNYDTGEKNFGAKLTSIRGLRPDVIFAPGNYTESALIIQQARDLGIKAPFIGGDTWETPEFIDVGKKSVDGVIFSTYYASEYPASPVAKSFLKEYRARYNRDPIAFTALGYDGYLVALDAIKRAGSTSPQAIRDAIAKTRGFIGASGTITMDADGNAIKSAYLKTVKRGKFVFKAIVNPR
jgi:branched-chain amino acid transport system substrate-binding protein